MNRKPCRCTLKDVPDGAALKQRIDEWIAALPAERRAEENIVNARLNACRACRWLADGTCGMCGCYVEFRAAQKTQRCPEGKWGQ